MIMVMERQQRSGMYYHLDADDDDDDAYYLNETDVFKCAEESCSNPLVLLADVAVYVSQNPCSIDCYSSASTRLKKLLLPRTTVHHDLMPSFAWVPRHCKRKRTALGLIHHHHHSHSDYDHKVKKKLKTEDPAFDPCKMDDHHKTNRTRKRKRPNNNKKSCNTANNKKHKKLAGKENDPPPRDLPDDYRDKINRIGGVDIKLVIQKTLNDTDMTTGQSKLSMPVNQVRNKNFLTDEEMEKFRKQKKGDLASIEVIVLDTRFEFRSGLNLRKWDMKSTSIYALTTKWNDLFQENYLKAGYLIQVWSFRVQGKLHFAIVLVSKADADQNQVIDNGQDAAVAAAAS